MAKKKKTSADLRAEAKQLKQKDKVKKDLIPKAVQAVEKAKTELAGARARAKSNPTNDNRANVKDAQADLMEAREKLAELRATARGR